MLIKDNGSWVVGAYVYTNGIYTFMDKHYKIRTIRMSDETWEALKLARENSKLSWNLFLWAYLKNSKLKKNKENT